MSASIFVTSAKRKLRRGDVSYNRVNSEAVQTKIAGSINGLIDSLFYEVDFESHGYFSNSNIFRSAPFRIQNTSDIIYYQFSIFQLGSSGNNVVNAIVRDENGVVVGNLFGTGSNRCLISSGTQVDCVIGRDLIQGTTFNVNTPSFFQYGVLNYTTLQAGWSLSFFIDENANAAKGFRFLLRLREQ